MSKTYCDADVARIIDTISSWERTKKSAYAIQFGGSHKYEVKAVTTPFFDDDDDKKTVRTYYVSSIAQFLFNLNQCNDYIQKVHAGWYNTVKGTYITAHYIDRVY